MMIYNSELENGAREQLYTDDSSTTASLSANIYNKVKREGAEREASVCP